MTEENNQILEAELVEEDNEITGPKWLKVAVPNFGLVNIPEELIERYRILEGTKTPFTGFDIVEHIESKEIAPETVTDQENELGRIETLHRKEEAPKPEIQGEKGSGAHFILKMAVKRYKARGTLQ
jgi:hypothetical protein